jgi:hypothetical protein
MSRNVLAETAGICADSIYLHERGAVVPGGDTLIRLVDALGCTLGDVSDEVAISA